MDFGILAKRAGRAAADNSPAILTALGVTGALTTAYLAGKASFKAVDVLREAEAKKHDKSMAAAMDHVENGPEPKGVETLSIDSELTMQEKITAVGHLYVPTAIMAITTVACIVGANHIGTRRAVALASAYRISEKAAAEYKAKVVEKVGKAKEQSIREAIAQDRINKNPPEKSTIIVVPHGGSTMAMDMHSGRYFNCDYETIRKAENDTNYQIIHEDYASLTDFWARIGLPPTAESDEIGWTSDTKLEVKIDTALDPNNVPCLAISFRTIPFRGYYSASY